MSSGKVFNPAQLSYILLWRGLCVRRARLHVLARLYPGEKVRHRAMPDRRCYAPQVVAAGTRACRQICARRQLHGSDAQGADRDVPYGGLSRYLRAEPQSLALRQRQPRTCRHRGHPYPAGHAEPARRRRLRLTGWTTKGDRWPIPTPETTTHALAAERFPSIAGRSPSKAVAILIRDRFKHENQFARNGHALNLDSFRIHRPFLRTHITITVHELGTGFQRARSILDTGDFDRIRQKILSTLALQTYASAPITQSSRRLLPIHFHALSSSASAEEEGLHGVKALPTRDVANWQVAIILLAGVTMNVLFAITVSTVALISTAPVSCTPCTRP